jgi:hypothetical protein
MSLLSQPRRHGRRWLFVGFVAVVLLAGSAALLAPLWPGFSSPLPGSAIRPVPATPELVTEPAEAREQPALAALPDLTAIDRRVIEPAYRGKPGYCLLVFGPRAATRVWLVTDGETLYVDHNANGDLTEPGEAFAPASRSQSTALEDGKELPYREWVHEVGDVQPADGSGKHTGLRLVRFQSGDRPAEHVLSVRYRGATLQYAGWGPLFAGSREQAPIIHLGGPVIPRPLRGAKLSLSEQGQELHFCVGTPGLGKHSFAFVGYESVPGAVHPVAEVAWPTEAGLLRERFRLRQRC